MKDSAYTEGGAGQPPEMPLGHSLYVLPSSHHSQIQANHNHLALRWLRLCKRVSLQTARLQQSELDAKLRRLHRRSQRIPDRVGPAGRHQDSDTESEFREPGEWVSDRRKDGTTRGVFQFLQGSDAEGEFVISLCRLL